MADNKILSSRKVLESVSATTSVVVLQFFKTFLMGLVVVLMNKKFKITQKNANI